MDTGGLKPKATRSKGQSTSKIKRKYKNKTTSRKKSKSKNKKKTKLTKKNKKTKKSQKSTKKSTKRTVRTPLTKRKKQPGSKCSAKAGSFKPNESLYGTSNSGCPAYATRLGNCCVIDTDKFRNAANMKQMLMDIISQIRSDDNLSEEDKNDLISYTTSRYESFDEQMSNIGIATKTEENFLIDTIRNSLNSIVRAISIVVTPLWNFLEKHISNAIKSAQMINNNKKNKKNSKDTDNKNDSDKSYASRFKNSITSVYNKAPTVVSGISGAAVGAATGFFKGGYTGAAAGALAGGTIAVLGPIKLIAWMFEKIKNNIWPVAMGVKNIVSTFIRDPGIIAEYTSTLLAIKRWICAEVGTYLKNPVLRSMYSEKGGTNMFNSALETGLEHKAKMETIKKVKNSAGSVTGKVSKVICTGAGGLVGGPLGSSLGAGLGDMIGSAMSKGMEAAIYKGNLEETYNNVMAIFSFDDCEAAYRTKRLSMFQKILEAEVSEMWLMAIESKHLVRPGVLEMAANVSDSAIKAANKAVGKTASFMVSTAAGAFNWLLGSNSEGKALENERKTSTINAIKRGGLNREKIEEYVNSIETDDGILWKWDTSKEAQKAKTDYIAKIQINTVSIGILNGLETAAKLMTVITRLEKEVQQTNNKTIKKTTEAQIKQKKKELEKLKNLLDAQRDILSQSKLYDDRLDAERNGALADDLSLSSGVLNRLF